MPRTTRLFITPTLTIVLLTGVLILPPEPGRAAMYSWIDADGVKHFTNQPPPENVRSFRQTKEIPYAEAEGFSNDFCSLEGDLSIHSDGAGVPDQVARSAI